uniref:Uncharacterized protein n=5 Tax=Aegilops tauschii subsp. strangulata TaxID=200361 RepID=A0A453F9A9_AEGTS
KHVVRAFLQKRPLVSPDQTRTPCPPPLTEPAAVLLSAAGASLLPATAAALLPAAAAALLPRSPAVSASCSAAAAVAHLPPQAPPFLKKIFDFPATAVLCSGCIGTAVGEPGGAGSGPPPTT